MGLPGAGDDIGRALGSGRRGLVVVHLGQEAAARIDIAPQVAGLAQLTHAGRQRLRVERLGNAAAPCQGVQGREVVGLEGRRCPGAGHAEGAGEAAEGLAGGMANGVHILEAQVLVLSPVGIGRALSSGQRLAQRRRQRRYLPPGVVAGVLVAGDHQLGNIVAHLHRGANRAARPGAVEPDADADDLVVQALGGKCRGDDLRRGQGLGRLFYHAQAQQCTAQHSPCRLEGPHRRPSCPISRSASLSASATSG